MNRKTIKIFLASSEEREVDRAKFGNLVRKLDKIYEKRGVRIEIVEWEDLDAAYNGVRKQDEYNEQIRESNMFLAVFHRQAGKFTIEEFDVASKEFHKHASPKIYTYVKDLHEGEQETPELIEFKQRLFDELGHYWCRYDNTDTMQLHFVMQLQMVDSRDNPTVKLEVQDSAVKLDGMKVAELKNVPFTANNEQYKDLQDRLNKIQEEITAFETILATTPNDAIEQMLGSKRTERFKIKEKIEEIEKSLFDTALTIVSLQGKASSERLRRAIERFEQGDNMGANAILDPKEIEADAQRNMENFRRGKLLTAEARKAILSNIEEYRLRAKTLLSIYDNANRFDEAEKCYDKAVIWAKEIEIQQQDLLDLLYEFASFLLDNARYNKALTIYQDTLSISTNI
ncbi:MAG: tetratricopeptide repeat protein, partial [Muribaculaceae bacterium]|nr:tetratricopeptide repeat protein [Muribaculaceae bacterium]